MRYKSEISIGLGKLIVLVLVLSSISGCTETSTCRKAPEVASKAAIKIVRWEQSLFAAKDTASMKKAVDAYPVFSEMFLMRSRFPHDSIMIGQLLKLSTSKFMDTLNQDVQKEFGNLEGISKNLNTAYDYLLHYYPETKVPDLYTLVSGFGTDLVVTDSMIVLGLDAFLGGKGHYQMSAAQTPMYIQSRMKPQNIVPSIILAQSKNYVDIDDDDNTLLASMIQWGKTYYFMENILPCTPDSLIIGYSPTEMKEVEDHLDIIWGYFVKRKLFFETNNMEVTRFIGERPKVNEIGQKCPGRIGRYLGWRIVQAYAKEHPELSMKEILENTNANQIFTESKYRPE